MLTYRAKIALTLGLLLLGFTGLVFVAIANRVHAQEDVAGKRATADSVRLLEFKIQEETKLLDASLANLAANSGIRALPDTDQATVSQSLATFASQIQADWLGLMTTDGKIMGASTELWPSGSMAGADLGRSKTIEGKNWSGLVSKAGGLYLVAARPILGSEFVRGALVGARKLDSSLLRQIELEDAETQLIYNGQVVASGIRGNLDNPITAFSQLNADGLQTPLGVEVRLPREAVEGPFAELRGQVLVALLFLSALGILVAFRIGGGFSKPIERLARAAQMMQAGEWPAPLGSDRQDEVGALIRAFDGMVAAMKDDRDQLLAMLRIDPLTGLLNQRSFSERLDSQMEEGPAEPPLTLFHVDLDRFAEFNSQHGKAAGDKVLVQIARLADSVCPEAVASRFAADEFLVLGRFGDPERVAENLRQRIQEETPLTVSIGFASASPDLNRSELLLYGAAAARDRAKHAGRNKCREFEGFGTADEAELNMLLQNESYTAIRALAEAVDAKDEYTRGHSNRVAEYARIIAQNLGLDEGYVNLIYITGTLHDVGKIGVPDAVLKKAGKLTDEEFEEIKKHPELGEKIVSQIPALRDTLPGIRSHHERWDGRGYPDGLAGEDMPLMARIMALADTFDAMTSDRPYRKGMTVDRANELICEAFGTQFDPSLQEAFQRFIGGWASDQQAA